MMDGDKRLAHDITRHTRAGLFHELGKQTPVFARFSTVAGERGAADAERDIRGFAVKFYTEEGNWDFWTSLPEALHRVTITMSDRGIPYGYRHMHGFGSHTFSLISADNRRAWVKFHFKTRQGIRNLTDMQAEYGEPPLCIDAGFMDRSSRYGPGDDCYDQAGDLFRLMSEPQKQALVDNTLRSIAPVTDNIKHRHAAHCYLGDPMYGGRIAKALGLRMERVAELAFMTVAERMEATASC